MTDVSNDPTILPAAEQVALMRKVNDQRAGLIAQQGASLELSGAVVEWFITGFIDDEPTRDAARLSWQKRRSEIYDEAEQRINRARLMGQRP